jgi:hypothetical protein
LTWYGKKGHGIGYAYYGLIVATQREEFRQHSIFVEVHTVPGHCFNWTKVDAAVWKNPPVGTRFVQPHDFLDVDFEPQQFVRQDVPVIAMTLASVNPFTWHSEFMERGVERTYMRPPPFGYYPSHPPQQLSPHVCPLLFSQDGRPPQGYRFDMAEWIILGAERSARYVRLGRMGASSIQVDAGALFEGIHPIDEYDELEADEQYRNIFEGPVGRRVRREDKEVWCHSDSL